MRLRPSVEISYCKWKENEQQKKGLTWRCLRVEYTTHQHQADRASDTRGICYVQQITSTPRFRGNSMSVLRQLSACYYNIVSRVTQRGKKAKEMRKTKNWLAGPIQQVSHMGYVEKACREKRRLRSEAQLSLRSTSCVVWPRYKKRDARFAAGLESSFSSWGDFSCCINP